MDNTTSSGRGIPTIQSTKRVIKLSQTQEPESNERDAEEGDELEVTIPIDAGVDSE